MKRRKIKTLNRHLAVSKRAIDVLDAFLASGRMSSGTSLSESYASLDVNVGKEQLSSYLASQKLYLPLCVRKDDASERAYKLHRALRTLHLKDAMDWVKDALPCFSSDAAFVKGVAADARYWGGGGVRGASDLDLVCRRDAFTPFCNALMGLGAKPITPQVGSVPLQSYEMFLIPKAIARATHDVVLDVHQGIQSQYGMQPIAVDRAIFDWQLHVEDEYIFYLCNLANDGCSGGLKHLADMVHQIRAPAFCVDSIAKKTRSAGLALWNHQVWGVLLSSSHFPDVAPGLFPKALSQSAIAEALSATQDSDFPGIGNAWRAKIFRSYLLNCAGLVDQQGRGLWLRACVQDDWHLRLKAHSRYVIHELVPRQNP